MAKDYYAILGVPRTATDAEIKKAYRTAAHQHHPDKSSGDEARFKEVNEAYQVLGNAEKRARYDRTGSAEGFPGGGTGAGFGGFNAEGFNVEDLGDLFSSMFSGGFGGGPTRQDRGSDLRVEFQISLEDAYRGGTHSFSVPAQVACATCSGSGAAEGSALVTCKDCAGKGRVTQTRRVLFGQFQQTVSCPACEGTGKVPEKPCPTCHGSGTRRGERKVSLQIDPGIRDGQVIEVKGMGDAGRRGMPDGSLGVRVRVVRHKTFAREGDDLVAHVQMSPLQLLAHAPVQVPVIEGGTTTVEIGAGTDLTEPYRVKGFGMPRFRGRGRGDLHVVFHVVTGKKPGKKEKELLEALGF